MNINSTEDRYLDIIAGPSKDRLFDACKYSYDDETRVPVEFSIALAYTKPKKDPGALCLMKKVTDLTISGIEHEDGTGDSLNLHGYCEANLTPYDDVEGIKHYSFRAYYNAKRRTGFITFIP